VTDLDTAPADLPPLRAFGRYWPMSFALAFLGLMAGIAVGSARAPIYTAEVRLAVGGQGLSSYAIPGFALASQQLAADYARYVSVAQDGPALKTTLGARAGEVLGLSASPVPNSSVVSIEAQAADGQLAMKAATAVGSALIATTNAQTNEQSAAALLAQYNTLSGTVAQANQDLQNAQQLVTKLAAATTTTATQLTAAQAIEVAAATKFASLQLQQTALASRYQSVATSDTPSSNLAVVQPAAIIFNNTTKNEELFGLVGLAAGGAIALVAATVRARLAKRRRNTTKTMEKKEKKKNKNDRTEADPPLVTMSDKLSSKASLNGSSVDILPKDATPEAPKEKNWPTRENPPRSPSPFARPTPPKNPPSLTPSAGSGDRNGETLGG
jgi:uncharacterized protein involved in exopolysaccharide biosynthesis